MLDANGIMIDISDLPTLQELTKRYAKAVLAKNKDRKEQTARLLGINRRTLYRWEREWEAESLKAGEGVES